MLTLDQVPAVPAEAPVFGTAGHIAEAIPSVGPDTRCEAVAERFAADRNLFAQPIVDADGTPLGLLNRFRLLERLSQRYGRDLFLRRPIVDCLDSDALLVDEHVRLETLAPQLFAGDRTHVLDGFVVTREGRYPGVGTGVTLTRALTELTVAQARAAVDAAARDNEAKSSFVAKVSHEIRTPLNGVMGLAELLQRTALTREQEELVNLLQVSGETLLSLIHDVLDFSKMQAAKLELESMPVDLRTMVDEIVKLLRVRAAEKPVRLTAVISPALPARIIGDPTRLRQVLMNLGGNAIKFTARGQVSFVVDAAPFGESDVRVALRVQDSGVGIPRDKQHLLFKPFSQIAASTSRQYGGTGLGLAITREIVERMGGSLSVDSEEGRGATFTVDLVLPAAEMAAAAAISPPDTADSPSMPAPRVLLAEDNAVNQLVASRLLKGLGCVVTIVEDGAAAITALQHDVFDFVLMDCDMPILDGIEATRRIRRGDAGAAARDVAIVALTANATTDSHAVCVGAGMDAFITKPVTVATLQRGLTEWRRRDARSAA